MAKQNGHFEKTTKEEIEELKKFSNTLSPWAKLSAGESKDWEFNPKHVKQITGKFGNERIEFEVYDPVEDHTVLFTTSKTAASKIVDFMKQGKNFLRIRREGSTMNDTKYFVEEVKG